MELKEFQLNAVKKLFEAMETPARGYYSQESYRQRKDHYSDLLYAPIHTVFPENRLCMAYAR